MTSATAKAASEPRITPRSYGGRADGSTSSRAPGWSTAWTHLQTALSFVPSTWMSASLLSFLVAATATITIGMPLRLRNRDRTDVDDATRPLSEVDNR